MKLYDIYSKTGEKFEVSKPNFDDLRTHYGFTANPPETSTAAIAAVIKDTPADGEESHPAAVHQERGSEEGERSAAEAGLGTAEPAAVPAEAGSEEGASEEEVSGKAAAIAALKDRHNFDADKRWAEAKLNAKLAELDEAASA